MEQKEKLKPCPFCNGMAMSTEKVVRLSPVVWKTVVCGKCGAETGCKLIHEEAIKAWNKRVNDG